MNAPHTGANRALARRLGIIALAMFGFGFLLVPFYEKICEATGLRNIGSADTAVNTQIDASRKVSTLEALYSVSASFSHSAR